MCTFIFFLYTIYGNIWLNLGYMGSSCILKLRILSTVCILCIAKVVSIAVCYSECSLCLFPVYIPDGHYDYLTQSGREHVIRLTETGTETMILSHIQVGNVVNVSGIC